MILTKGPLLALAGFCISLSVGAQDLAQDPAQDPAQVPARGLTPVPFHRVEVDDSFWSPRIASTLSTTLDACLAQCEQTHRIANFSIAAGESKGEHRGALYNDSDLYKIIQGAGHALAFRRDAAIETKIDAIIASIVGAQQKDGYINTYYTLKEPSKRWTNIAHGHELYCAGHLIEAGIAYFHATEKRALLDVAIGFADHIDRVFGPDGIDAPPGHQEIELALLDLAELTGEARYGKLARFFLEARGRHKDRTSYGDYSQDHAPVRKQDKAVGHSVRAMYQACAATDIARLDGDLELQQTLTRLWEDIAAGKIYVTGGIGAVAGIEGFAPAYILPNDTAYAETCAAIAIAMWDHRLLLLTRESRYADGLERALYNGMLSGIDLHGDRFFYQNPLGSRGDRQRAEWFRCACCPSNLVRFLPAIGGMIYAQDEDDLYVQLYVGSKTEVKLASGPVKISQETRFPWSGQVNLKVNPQHASTFGIHLRRPAWCEQATLSLNGKEIDTANDGAEGWMTIRRRWQPGDQLSLKLAMPVRTVSDDPRVETNQGRVTLQRGPLVYCLEGIDHDGHCRDIALPETSKLKTSFDATMLGGIVKLEGQALRKTGRAEGEAVQVTAIPYYAWNNRGKGEMVTWIPTSLAVTELDDEGPAAQMGHRRISASHCFGSDSVKALFDGELPASSDDHSIPRLTFWPHRGEREHVTCRLDANREVSRCKVYWFDDGARKGGCRTPKSWRMMYRSGSAWKPVTLVAGQSYGTAKDRFESIRFAAVTASAFRLEIALRDGFSAGILEWEIE